MPLLLCPNCNASMSSVNRRGVEFDMCPTCRGVWLDRGELEKLMAAAEDEARTAAPQAPPFQTHAPPPPRYERDDDYRRPRWDDDDHRHRYPKKKKLDLFDIFD